MELKGIKIDENWITPAALAEELKVAPSTVSNWISRNQIDYMALQGAIQKRYLVDRRTAPAVKPKGNPEWAKKKKMRIAWRAAVKKNQNL